MIFISSVNKLSIGLQVRYGGRALIYIFGIIGIPIHEFSHYLFCLIFRHKVHDVKFFSPNWETGVFGYVKHSRDKNSIYQAIGQVFISIAPMIVGTFFISVLVKVFKINDFSIKYIISEPVLAIKYMVFIYIFMGISSHMIWSKQDIKNCFSGVIYTSIFIIVCILLVPNVFVFAFNTLLFIAKLTIFNFLITYILALIIGKPRQT